MFTSICTGPSLIDYFTTLFTFSTNGVKYDFKTDIREDSEVGDSVDRDVYTKQ